jgi:hypothetical protein
MMRFENNPIPAKTVERAVKWAWIAGAVVWCPVVLLLWLHVLRAQTSAQSLLFCGRLAAAGLFGIAWSISGTIWLRRHKKFHTT